MLYDEHKEVIWQSAGGYVKKIEKPGVGRPLLGPAIKGDGICKKKYKI